jgi:hypothetical protein
MGWITGRNELEPVVALVWTEWSSSLDYAVYLALSNSGQTGWVKPPHIAI